MSTIYSHLMTCAADQKWGGQACEDCAAGPFSAGGSATSTSANTCNADKYWNGQACGKCEGCEYLRVRSAADEEWRDHNSLRRNRVGSRSALRRGSYHHATWLAAKSKE